LKLKVRYTEEQKELILKTCQERGSVREVRRLFGVSRPTLIAWVKSIKVKELM
jgi:transposase-like protein